MKLRLGARCVSLVLCAGTLVAGNQDPSQGSSGGIALDVSGRNLFVPVPIGLVEPSPEQWERIRSATVLGDVSRLLMAFVPEGTEANEPEGEHAFSRSGFLAQIVSSSKDYSRFADFEKLKKVLVDPETVGKAKSKLERGKTVGEAELKFETPQLLEPHLNQERVFAFSLLSDLRGDGEPVRMSTTQVFVLVKARILQLSLSGIADDLEWTREAARSWSNAVLGANPSDSQSTAEENAAPPWQDSLSTLLAVTVVMIPVFFIARYRAKKTGVKWPRWTVFLVLCGSGALLGFLLKWINH